MPRALCGGSLCRTIGLKLISFLLAVGLWFAVARQSVAEVEMKVPIEFQNLPDNLEIDSASFTEAQIRMRGPERVIHRLQAADVRAEIDLAKRSTRRTDFRFRPAGMFMCRRIWKWCRSFQGSFISSFDNGAHSCCRGTPARDGILPAACGRRSSPIPSVTITGPRRRVEAVEAATTDPVDASGTMTQTTFVTQAYVADPLIQVVHPTPIRVTVIMGSRGRREKVG